MVSVGKTCGGRAATLLSIVLKLSPGCGGLTMQWWGPTSDCTGADHRDSQFCRRLTAVGSWTPTPRTRGFRPSSKAWRRMLVFLSDVLAVKRRGSASACWFWNLIR